MYTQHERALKAKQMMMTMMHIDRLHNKRCERAFSKLNLHRSQHIMLMTISRSGGLSQKEFAKELNVSPAAVAKLLKKLETDGLIKRSCTSYDARQNETTLTEKGRALVEETHRIVLSLDTTTAEYLGDEDLDTLNRLMSKLKTAYENENKTLQEKELPQ